MANQDSIESIPRRFENETGIVVSVTKGGSYEIADRQLNWSFSGRIDRRVAELDSDSGEDRAGSYREFVFAFHGRNNGERRGVIRLYDRRSVVMFQFHFCEAGEPNEAFP
jgi:hypothetical protein